jgi:hypothetical protein
MRTLRFNEFINEGFDSSTPEADELGRYFIRLLAIRDQAHIFHWQTESFAQHEAFGEFYETFLTNVDAMVEMVMGLKGRPMFGEGASIMISDYSPEAINGFFESAYPVFGNKLEMVCSPDENEEIFDQARVIVADIDKLKYLLTLS